MIESMTEQEILEGAKKVRGLTGMSIFTECKEAFIRFQDVNKAAEYLRDKWSGVWVAN